MTSQDPTAPPQRLLTQAQQLVVVAGAVLAASALALLAAAVHIRQPAGPASSALSVGQPSGPSVTAPSPASSSTAVDWPMPAPPSGVRVVAVPGAIAGLDVTWTDPSGGTRVTIVSLASDGGPLRYLAAVQAATSHARIARLSWGVRYCVGVATAYTPGLIVAAAPGCRTLSSRSPSASSTRAAG